jgi:hypothetical protein
VIEAADNNLCLAALFSYRPKGVFDKLSTRTRARSIIGVSAVPVINLAHGDGNDGHLLLNCQFCLLQRDKVVDLRVYAVSVFNPASPIAMVSNIISTSALKRERNGECILPRRCLNARQGTGEL